jgi:hypothetical protein
MRNYSPTEQKYDISMKAVLTLLTGLGLTLAAHAYDPLGETEKNDYVEPDAWREGAVEIPHSFNPEDLQRFSVKGESDLFDYAIERQSLLTGNDGVTRFTVVIQSTRGAVNTSYEGLRCGHREYKVYAYGSGQGLTPLPGSDWQPIPKSSSDYRAILYEDLICNLLTGQPNPPDAVFQAMRSDRQVDAPFINNGRD